MREEIYLLKQWMAEEPVFYDEAERILAADNKPIPEEQLETVTGKDTAADLVSIFHQITRPNKREWIGQLHANKSNFLNANGEPRWFDGQDTLDFFNMRQVPHRNPNYPAWVLSNPRGSNEYFGEWFERSGKVTQDKKFRTRQFRLRQEALDALDTIFGGMNGSFCEWQEVSSRH